MQIDFYAVGFNFYAFALLHIIVIMFGEGMNASQWQDDFSDLNKKYEIHVYFQ